MSTARPLTSCAVQPLRSSAPSASYCMLYTLHVTLYVSAAAPTKLCFLADSHSPWDFAPTDGHNPSVLLLPHPLNTTRAKYVSTIVVGESQCVWPPASNAATRRVRSRTVLVLLDSHFQTLAQTTLQLEGTWNRTAGRGSKAVREDASTTEEVVHTFDDAKLFLHEGRMFITYRSPGKFGHTKQLLNPLYLDGVQSLASIKTSDFSARVLATETVIVCCGRNIAFISVQGQENRPVLLALVWLEPLRVLSVRRPCCDLFDQMPSVSIVKSICLQSAAPCAKAS